MSTTLIHHAANRGHLYPPNSLQALRFCLDAGAKLVEVDITPLRHGDFALLHEMHLARATDGVGFTHAMTAAQATQLHYACQGAATDEPIGLLSQAVALVRDYPSLQELQLDLKPHAPLTDDVSLNLLDIVEPIKHRVRVTSVADWALRHLVTLDADLLVGFDPLLYLDVDRGETSDDTTPPYNMGAYGYLDDHALASRRWESAAEYLTQRAETLRAQVPSGTAWYIRASLLVRALDDGFDWIAQLQAEDTPVAAWTLDVERPDQVEWARRLVALGIDRITTNDVPRLARTLDQKVES